MNLSLKLKNYFNEELLQIKELRKFFFDSAVVTVELDEKLILDLIVFIPDQLFNNEFVENFGDCFVVNHQKQLPHIFTRFKSYQWLKNDFSNRLNIALWIFTNSIVIQDPDGSFRKILREYSEIFRCNLDDAIRRKYIEFRSDRHNLRQVIFHKNKLSIDIIRANVAKLALEILILANGNPYPYKKWLEDEAAKYDGEICRICNEFTKETNLEHIITLSDQLVSSVANTLLEKTKLPPQVINEWWLHLK
jgi:hypothetical protein